jgi:hypothetical protein
MCASLRLDRSDCFGATYANGGCYGFLDLYRWFEFPPLRHAVWTADKIYPARLEIGDKCQDFAIIRRQTGLQRTDCWHVTSCDCEGARGTEVQAAL